MKIQVAFNFDTNQKPMTQEGITLQMKPALPFATGWRSGSPMGSPRGLWDLGPGGVSIASAPGQLTVTVVSYQDFWIYKAPVFVPEIGFAVPPVETSLVEATRIGNWMKDVYKMTTTGLVEFRSLSSRNGLIIDSIAVELETA